jgi:uncharacterized protein (TIGR02217 family)
VSITVFSNVVLPNAVIQAGVRGKQIRRNSRVTTVNGAEHINIVWSQTLREFEIGIVPMLRTAWQDIEALHEITEGGAYGFLMEDPKDQAVAAGEGVVVGLTSTTFQLNKRYMDAGSGRSKNRKITRPRAAGFVLTYLGAPFVSPTHYTLDANTGVITTVDPGLIAANFAWTGRFYVPVHFLEDSIDWSMVISGPTTDARFLAGPSVILQEIRE